MAFQWPPAIFQKTTQYTSYPFFFTTISDGGNSVKHGTNWTPFLPYKGISSGITQYLAHFYDLIGYQYTYHEGTAQAGYTTAYGSASGSLNGRDGLQFTTTNSVAGSGGAFYIEYMNGNTFPDYSNAYGVVAAWSGPTAGTAILFKVSDNSGTYAYLEVAPSTISFGTECRIARVSASKYLILHMASEPSGMSSVARMRYVLFDKDTSTLTTVAYMPTIETNTGMETGFEIFDAGEGYYYVAYVISGNLYIRGIDCSSGTPVLTGLLGGSGTTTFNGVAGAFTSVTESFGNQVRRYITVGSDRVIAFMAGSRFVRITYTSAAKGTPTIATAVRTGLIDVAASIVLEYDPLDQTQAYIVRWDVAAVVGSGAIIWRAEYANVLGTITSNFTGYSNSIVTINDSSYDGKFGPSMVTGAASGEFALGFGGLVYVDPSSQAKHAMFSYSCWHTPANFDRGIEVGVGYSSVSNSSRIVLQSRGANVGGGDYSALSLAYVIPGAFIDRFSWTLSVSTVYEYSVTVNSTYNSVSADAEIIQIVEALPLVQNWISVGTTWMNDFMVYLNQDRAAVGMPRYKTWGEDGLYVLRKDVAQLHSDNMVRYRTYQHESTSFPAGQGTVLERGDIMPCTGLAENLLINPSYHLVLNIPNSNYTATNGYITPYDAWLAWHNSPGHYANIIQNWGEKNNIVYSLMGAEDGQHPLAYYPHTPASMAGIEDWVCLYLCNNFASLEILMFEIPLDQYWVNSGALISAMDQEWSNDSWAHVSARHESSYSIRVASSQFDARWGCRVSTQHVAPITYSAAAQHVAPYEAALPITPVQHEASYAIKNTTPVVVQHEAGFALRVASQSEAGYSLLLPVKQEHSADFRIFDTQPVAQQHEISYSTRIAAQSEAEWTLTFSVAAQHSANYGEVIPVRTQAQHDYAILQSNPIRVEMAHYYAMVDYTTQLALNNVVTLILADGQRIRVDDGVIDSAAGDAGYSFECAIDDVDTFTRINEDDPIVVDFCGELYNFIVSSKSMTREGPASVVMRISADNAVVRTGQPYAKETDFIQESDISASDLVNALVEIDFNYELVDWTILSGRLQVAGATSLEAITQIAEATGGVVDGNPAGHMWLRYPYPIPMTSLDTATVDQYYADDYDNLSVSISTQYRDGATKFRIREGDSAFADALEWVPDVKQTDPQYQTGIVKAYLSPYRSTAAISHLGNAVYVIPIGEEIELHEELIEFSEGVGNTTRPIETLLSIDWFTDSMGTPAYSPFSTLLNVNPTVNKGYGLAKVRYNAKHLTAKAGGLPATVDNGEVGPASSYAYFILEDSNG